VDELLKDKLPEVSPGPPHSAPRCQSDAGALPRPALPRPALPRLTLCHG